MHTGQDAIGTPSVVSWALGVNDRFCEHTFPTD
jgi:hypothetical protein